MEKSNLVECLRLLDLKNVKDIDYTSFLEANLSGVYNILGTTHQDILFKISDIVSPNFSENINLEWKYICLGSFIIKSIGKEAEKSDHVFLSVQETKDLKCFLDNLVIVGIRTKLLPNLPFHMQSKYFISEDIFWNYNVLKCTTSGLITLLKYPVLRLCILSENFKFILTALYQICYGPLKKPTDDATNPMTKVVYEKLIQEQACFLEKLNSLRETTNPNIFIRETMLMFNNDIAGWFKKRIFQNLTTILRSPKGVQTIASVLLGNYENDTQNWKELEVFSKLILHCAKFPDFEENICKQLIHLLHNQNAEKTVAENIFAHLTKVIYKENAELCIRLFVREILTPILQFTDKTGQYFKDDITEIVKWISRMLHKVFVEGDVKEKVLPSSILTNVIAVIFRLFILTTNSSFKTVNNELRDVLLKYFESNQQRFSTVLDVVLFNIQSSDVLLFRDDIDIEIVTNKIILKYIPHSVLHSCSDDCEIILKLFKPKSKLLMSFFGYFLNCISNESKYFPKSNEGLVQMEEDFTATFIHRKIVVYKMVSELAEEQEVQKQLHQNPLIIVGYIQNVLRKTLQFSTHTNEDHDSEGFQSVFTVLMILENLLETSSKDNYIHYKVLVNPLKQICEETANLEIQNVIQRILDMLQGNKINNPKVVQQETKTTLDQILEDVCDPLLPTRGHGLICLTKLIENKDTDAMERKHFILNILQQNLNNKDSFIYLSAINGLAAMGDIFPDTVIKILCEEYSESSRQDIEDYSESRMKLGEVLLKVCRTLGDMAPKYKPLLLNTFLAGTRDEDDLIRSSALSNLGEICGVLGYKLGSMFTEVLICVHAIISTDKSPQARRAAVTVIRQLFVGFDQEIISFFKDDILPVYRTLKQIYSSDKDDVMRLQAQLALEELNERMKNFVFPNAQLHSEKKIVMLD